MNQLVGKKDLVIVEVGVATGSNSVLMLENLDIKKIYLVDPYVEYMENGVLVNPEHITKDKDLKKYKQIVWVKKFSVDAVKDFKDKSVNFVYIDANHQYEFVKEDIEVWLPKVKKGGILGGHDYNEAGVKQAVNERFKKFNSGNINWWDYKDEDKIMFRSGEQVNLIPVKDLKYVCEKYGIDREIYNYPKDWWVKV